MKHTDFGEWRVTHDDLRIYQALQNCTLELTDYSDPQKMLETVSNIGGETERHPKRSTSLSRRSSSRSVC
jgi:hypothetical protein